MFLYWLWSCEVLVGDTRQEKAVKLDFEQELTDMLTDYTWWHDVYGM